MIRHYEAGIINLREFPEFFLFNFCSLKNAKNVFLQDDTFDWLLGMMLFLADRRKIFSNLTQIILIQWTFFALLNTLKNS